MSKFMKLGLLVVGMMTLSLTAGAFTKNQAADSVQSEVQGYLSQTPPMSLADIAKKAKDADLASDQLIAALQAEGQGAVDVVEALVTAGYAGNTVVNQVYFFYNIAGTSPSDFFKTLADAAVKADPTLDGKISQATASGPGQNQNSTNQSAPGGNSTTGGGSRIVSRS